MKLILLCVWAEPAVLGSTKTALNGGDQSPPQKRHETENQKAKEGKLKEKSTTKYEMSKDSLAEARKKLIRGMKQGEEKVNKG